jgi:pre-rRNA-processing protein TSR3
MFYFPPTIIFRHHKENLKKCSLRGLETRSDLNFFTYPLSNEEPLPDLTGYVLLSFEGPLLSSDDRDRGIFLIDGTWRYAAVMEKNLPPEKKAVMTKRSLPATWMTAYPRVQTGCTEAKRGLASVEALYVAYQILGRDTTGLLDFYPWRNAFLH